MAVPLGLGCFGPSWSCYYWSAYPSAGQPSAPEPASCNHQGIAENISYCYKPPVIWRRLLKRQFPLPEWFFFNIPKKTHQLTHLSILLVSIADQLNCVICPVKRLWLLPSLCKADVAELLQCELLWDIPVLSQGSATIRLDCPQWPWIPASWIPHWKIKHHWQWFKLTQELTVHEFWLMNQLWLFYDCDVNVKIHYHHH